MNTDKTVVIVIYKKTLVPRCNARINSKMIKQVRRFSYLGSCISEDDRRNIDIKRRICESKKVF